MVRASGLSPSKMMRLTLLLLAAVGCFAAEEKCEPSVTHSGTIKGPICKGALIFEDNFDFLDWSKWSHEITMAGGGNWEFQVYWADPGNSFAAGGNLNLHPGKLADIYGNDFLYSGTLDLGPSCTVSWNWGCVRTGNAENILNPATSARLHTVNTFGFTYGVVEARARLPAGDWIWPAIWMMPRDSAFGEWPASGEIDIMESRGNRDLGSFDGGVNIGVEQVASTMHWGVSQGNSHWYVTHWEKNTAPGAGFHNDFHLYQLEWTPDFIRFSVDNEEIGRVTPPAGGFYELGGMAGEGLPNPWAGQSKMAPFDRDFYLILNVAVGGTNGYFPDGVGNPGGKPWSNTSPTAFKDFWEARGQWEGTWQGGDSTNMLVDYVRVWAL